MNSIQTLDDLADILGDPGRTDTANADRFAAQNADKLRFVPEWKRWLTWDGTRWHDDSGTGVAQRAKRYARGLWAELGRAGMVLEDKELCKLQTFIKKTNSENGIRAFISLAESDVRLVAPAAKWNQKPLLLNVLNGTIDLATGELRKHNPADHLTQLAPVMFDADATCPQWLGTLDLIFECDVGLIKYVQELLGYSMTGDIGEHILPIAVGSGCNGKSTLWNTTTELLGEYAALANDSLLLGDDNNHPTDRAALFGKRFVAISEPERGARLRESRVKELTGDAMVTARRMREDFWTFKRTHKFWLSTNHLPRVDGTDEGIWRRVKLIPFRVDLRKVVDPIPDYPAILVRDEGPGILNWLLEGWARYRDRGRFAEPETVSMATASYRADSDTLGEWVAEYCVIEQDAEALSKDLFAKYQATGGKWTSKAFGLAMAERFERVRETVGPFRNKTVYRGIRLRQGDGETPEKTVSRTVAPSRPVDSTEKPIFLGVTGEPCATMRDDHSRTCSCGNPLAVTPCEPGWQNVECLACGTVKAERVPA